eukprot:m.77555 g.77555  ORF g.77555 m.77555 type:complete len:160 (+) comp14470_c0_seq1:19-498(+)
MSEAKRKAKGPGKADKRAKTEPTLRADASEIEQAFFKYAKDLTAKHDRHERLVKLSRDVTIHSKRAIFLLHRITPENHETTMAEAKDKLDSIRDNLHAIAVELQDQDPAQFNRAFSPGVQEYIEAATFYAYNQDQSLATLQELEDALDKGDAQVENQPA